MSIRNATALSVLLAVSALACGPGPLSETSTQLEICAGELDPIDITQASIEGDQLRLSVGFGGGCESHEFRLCWNEEFLESDPVQAPLTLQHDGHGDPCEAYLSEELAFDLGPLRDAYIAAYRQDHATIALNIGEGLDYEF